MRPTKCILLVAPVLLFGMSTLLAGVSDQDLAGMTIPPLFPQAPARSKLSEDGPWARKNIFKRIVNDQKYLVMTWWPRDFHNAAFTVPLIAATATAFASTNADGNEERIDQEIAGDVQVSEGGDAQEVAEGFTKLGNGAPVLLGIGTTYLIGRWTGNERLADTMSLATEALVDSGIWETGLKRIFARTRPSNGGRGDFFQYSPPPGQSNSSFPSGHAMGAFTLATVVSKMYPEKQWVPWVFYGTAGAIAASRVALGRHFPTDVIVGGLLGNSIGRMVVARQRESGRDGPGSITNFRPIADPASGRFGLIYDYSW